MNQTGPSTVKPPIRWGYLLGEAGLFLLLCYLTFMGGINDWSNLVQPAAMNLGLALLVGGGWLAWRILRRSPFPATRLDLPLLVVLAVTALTSLTSVDPRRSAVLVWQLLLYALLFYLLVDLLRSGVAAELLEKTILLSSVPVIAVGFSQIFLWVANWFALGDCARGFSLPSYRVYSILANANIFAGYLNLILPLGIVRSLRSCRWTRAAWAAWSSGDPGIRILYLVQRRLVRDGRRGGHSRPLPGLGAAGEFALGRARLAELMGAVKPAQGCPGGDGGGIGGCGGSWDQPDGLGAEQRHPCRQWV